MNNFKTVKIKYNNKEIKSTELNNNIHKANTIKTIYKIIPKKILYRKILINQRRNNNSPGYFPQNNQIIYKNNLPLSKSNFPSNNILYTTTKNSFQLATNTKEILSPIKEKHLLFEKSPIQVKRFYSPRQKLIQNSPILVKSFQSLDIDNSIYSPKVYQNSCFCHNKIKIDNLFQKSIKRSQATIKKFIENNITVRNPSFNYLTSPLNSEKSNFPKEISKSNNLNIENFELSLGEVKNQEKIIKEDYIGEKVEGKRHGTGICTYNNEIIYEGEWENNEKNGFGCLKIEDKEIYSGEWKNNKYSGKGILFNINDEIFFQTINYKDFNNNFDKMWEKYEGEFINGLMHGIGTILFKNGYKFVGNFEENQVSGKGSFYLENNKVIVGKWNKNKLLFEF